MSRRSYSDQKGWTFDKERLYFHEGIPLPDHPRWRTWQEPPFPLPIDKQVTALRKRTRPPKLRPREEIERLGAATSFGPCPYLFARSSLSQALSTAQYDAGKYEEDRRHTIRALANARRDIIKLQSSVQKLLENYDEMFRRPVFLRRFSESPLSYTEELANLSDALRNLDSTAGPALSRINDLHRRGSVNQGDIWKVTLVGWMGFAWRFLTASDPPLSEPFIQFITASWNSLGDDLPPQDWERAIRTAQTRYAGQWDYFEAGIASRS